MMAVILVERFGLQFSRRGGRCGMGLESSDGHLLGDRIPLQTCCFLVFSFLFLAHLFSIFSLMFLSENAHDLMNSCSVSVLSLRCFTISLGRAARAVESLFPLQIISGNEKSRIWKHFRFPSSILHSTIVVPLQKNQ